MSEAEPTSVVEVGKKYKIYYWEGNPNNCTHHVRAIVDGDQVVARIWSKRKRGWFYVVNHLYLYTLLQKDGYLLKRR